MDGVTVCRSGYQSVIRSYRRTDGQGLFPDRRKAEQSCPFTKAKYTRGFPSTAPCKEAFENGNDRPAVPHRPKGGNNKVGFGIVGKVSTTSANSQVHKADSIAEPIRHGQTADTPQGIYEENAVIY